MLVKELIAVLKNEEFEGMRVKLVAPQGLEGALFVSAYENRDGVLIEGPRDIDVCKEIEARRQELSPEKFYQSLIESGFSWFDISLFTDEQYFTAIKSEFEANGLVDRIPGTGGGMFVAEMLKRLEKQDPEQPVYIGQLGVGLVATIRDDSHVSLICEP